MFEDRDLALDALGALILVGLVAALGVAVLAAMAGPTGASAPDAEFELDRINETHVEITHAGGEPVDTEKLVVTVVRYERQPSWDGTLFEGSSGVVQAQEGQIVKLSWNGGRADQVLLERWEPGNATTTAEN